MLTGLKMSSLACKCLFYRPEDNVKGEPDGILKILKCKNEIDQRIELKE